jgi:transposase InsO family protein
MDPFIEAEEVAGHSVSHCCELFEVSRSAYYQRKSEVPSAREVSDAELTEKITAIHAESRGTYGSPRVHQKLVKNGVACGRRRVRRLMREAGLEGRCKKRWRKTTVPDPAAERAEDLIQRHFGPARSWTAATWATSPTSRPGRVGPTWPRSSTWPTAGTPVEALDELLRSAGQAGVATTR